MSCTKLGNSFCGVRLFLGEGFARRLWSDHRLLGGQQRPDIAHVDIL